MEIRLLGPIEVVGTKGPVDLGGGRPTRLLVALASSNQRRLTLDQLVDRCFNDDEQPKNPISALRTAVRRLRRALGDEIIRTHRGGYELNTGGVEFDIDRFDELIAAGRATTDPVAAQTKFHQALEMWRGTPFGGLGELDWLVPERVRLEELYLVGLEGWHDAHLRNGTVTEIIPSLEATAAAHPRRERFHRQLMQALYVAERQPDALRVFQDFRDEMIDAGLEPSAETVELEQRIAIGDPSLRAKSSGRALRGYVIDERLGEGAFSIVYRGMQPSVDRPVAIKQIRAELANRPEFIRRFETEAHLVARLEHPHIVPLYDYWREPDSAYLVMRYLRGGNLETRLHHGRWDLDKTLGMVHQIGDALATAHRAGVVHRDVKPANILLDENDNAYLADFGIALEAAEAADPAAALSAGSPAYAAPEQLQRLPVGPAADVHGLAIATYEALTAQLPFPDEPNQAAMLQRQLHDPIPPVRNVRPDLPTAVDAVLAKATAKAPTDRYQSVEGFIAALDEASAVHGPAAGAAGGTRRTMIAAEERNPYKGLRAFDEADAGDFSGRERLVDQLVSSLDEHRLVAVVGPSGSGKSSVVRAGLLPAVRQGRIRGSSDWFITTLIPGARPFEELEASLLRIASERPPDLLRVLSSGERGIARGLRHAVPEDDAQVLLVIDQFEEVFTLAEPAETIAFLNALASAVSEDRSRLRVVVTLRADFYDRPLRHEAIGRLVRDATVAVLPLAPDELEHAIVDPAHAVGGEFEPGLVAEIAADLADQPGALPLLQYALTELYEQRQSGLMTRDAYRKLGGVAGALTRRAEDLFSESEEDERTAIRRIFGRLVSLGEGTEDTRRRALRRELGEDPAVGRVVDRFGVARLLAFDRDPGTREPTVEVAHEALLREWPRLSEWLDEDRDGLRILRHINTTATEWDKSGRPDAELYRGGRLETAVSWSHDRREDLTPIEADFVASSVARQEAEDEAERAASRRLRRLLAGVGSVAIVALVAGVFAFQQRGAANDNAAAAETERIAAQAATLSGKDLSLSLLLAVEAFDRDPGPVGLGALQDTLANAGSFLGLVALDNISGVQWIDNSRMVAVGPSGAWVVGRDGTSDQIGEAGIYEVFVDIGEGNIRIISMFDIAPDVVAFVRSDDPTVADVISVSGDHITSVTHASPVDAVQLSSNGSTLLSLDLDGWLTATDVRSGDESWRVRAHPETIEADIDWPEGMVEPVFGLPKTGGPRSLNGRPQLVRIDEVGARVITVEADMLRRWSLDDGRQLGDDRVLGFDSVAGFVTLGALDDLSLDVNGDRFVGLASHTMGGGSVDDGPPGELVAIDTSAVWWALPKVDRVWWDGGDTASVLFSDGRLGEVDRATGELVDELLTGLTAVSDFGVSPDGSTVAFAANEGIGLWSRVGDGLIASGIPRAGTQLGQLLGDDIIAASYARIVATDWKPAVWWDDSGPTPVRIDTPTDGHPPDWGVFRWGDETFGSFNQTFRASFWDLESRRRLSILEMPFSWNADAISPDASLGAFGTNGVDGLMVFTMADGKVVATLTEPGPLAPSMSFSPDGAVLATVGGDRLLRLYSTESWQLLSIPKLDGVAARAIDFSTDGRFLVTLLDNGDLVLRNTADYDVVRTLVGPGRDTVTTSDAFLFDETGRYLITSSGRLWDLDEGVQVGEAFPNAPDFRIGGKDGFELLTAVDEHILRWNLDFDSWVDIACQAAGRNMTLDEWNQFGPSGADYRAICSQWPPGDASPT